MSNERDNPLHIDQDALIAGAAALGDWMDKHGPAATLTWGAPVIDVTPKRFAVTVTRVRHLVRRYRKHGERRGVVRRQARIVADVEWER